MHMTLFIGDMSRNCIQHHAPTDDSYIYLVKYIIIFSYSSNFNLFFFKFTNSDIVLLFLSMDLRKYFILITMFARLTCIVYYIGCWVSLFLGYSANESSMYNRVFILFILLIQVGYLGIAISLTSLQ